MEVKYRKLEKLYEGKAKKVFRTDADGVYIVEYKDDATAGNGAKKGLIRGKGEVNNRVSNHLMRLLEGKGVPTHFIEELGPTESAVRRLSIVPLEVIVRNIAAGSLAARLGLPEGTRLRSTVLEYCYKDDALGDPKVNDYHIAAMGWASAAELKTIAALSFRINNALGEYLKDAGIELIDFKLEFGRLPAASKRVVQSESGDGELSGGEIILADEISPDTCRFWDSKTGEKLDKDRFRRDLGGVEDAYREVMRRLLGRD
ncbi:MAG: phosphoribosylaminoimidazolesuccinocarboxamide synthase [Spirochaetaceae bacterium]|jgi:phosphoribosylaminoimidazole-succinocarboxamide synthase|nr:phosphoribosylaminoimidazolesuccinocarboxamide synthase [Spirochaetaceae bacterium]